MRNRKKRLWFKRQAELKRQREAVAADAKPEPAPVVKEKTPVEEPVAAEKPVIEAEPKPEPKPSSKPAPKPKRVRKPRAKKSSK